MVMRIRPPPKIRKPPPPRKVGASADEIKHHRLIMKRVSAASPYFDKFNRWAVEIAFIDAAYLYEYSDEESGMSDAAWDALGAYLHKTWAKRSPFFKNSVNKRQLAKKATGLAIHWEVGLGRASKEFWQ